MLLLWAPSVTPSAGVKLVTIRFSSAVYLESIRIVPRGVAPFSQEPLFIGETTPNSFRLKIYLNYQTSSDGKAKATNTLLTSSLLYSGELMEHQLNAEQQFSTRLMILEGDFERISVAIYGETAIPESNAGGPNELKYSPSILPSTSPSALPPSIDMSLTSNPSSLSKAIIDAMGSRQSLDDLIKIVLSDSRDQPRQAMDITEEPGASAPSTFSLPSVLPPSPPASSDDSTIYGSWTNDAFQALRARFGSKRDLGYEQSSDITASIYLGVASLLVVMVWISWEEPATKSGGMFERCLLIVRRWLSDPQHREITLSILSSKYIFPTIVDLYNQPSTAQIAALTHQILSAIVSDPASLVETAVSDALEGIDVTQLAIPDEAIRLTMGDATYAMEYVSQIATGSTLTLSESIALRVALHRLLKFLHLGENGYQSLLEVAWAEKHQGLIYSLLDVLDCAATEISRSIEPTNHIIPTGQFAETILNTIADLLQLVSGLLPLSPITSRTSSRLTAAIVTIQSVVHYLLNDLSDNSSLSKAVNAAGNLAIHTFSTLVSLIGSGEEAEADQAILTTLISSNVLFNPHTDVTTRPMLILDLMLQHIPNPSMEASCTRYLRSLVGVLPQFTQFIALLDGDKRASLLLLVMNMDDGRTGIGEYVILQELRDLDEALVELVSIGLSVAEEHVVKRALVVHQITSILQFLVELHKGRPYLAEDVRHYLTRNEEAVSKLGDCFYLMTRDDIITEFSAPLAHELASSAIRQERKELALFLLITVLRSVRLTTQPLSAADALSTSLSLSDFLFETSSLSHAELDQIFIELGAVIVHLSSQPSEDLDEIEPIAQAIFSLLELVKHQQDRVGWNRAAVKVEEEEYADYDDEIGSSSGAGRSCPMVLPGLTEDVFQRLVDFYDTALPEVDRSISSFKHDIGWSVPRSDLTPVYPLQSSAPLITSIAMIQTALDAKEETASTPPPPSTPPAILGLVSLSPFTALRSPTTRVTTLTKTYANNDFRQLRTSPHMNTSRPPSMHVDDFELSNSPTASVRPLPPQLLPSHIPSNW